MWVSFRSDSGRGRERLPDAKGTRGRELPILLSQWAMGSGATLIGSKQRYLSLAENLEEQVYHKPLPSHPPTAKDDENAL